MDRRLRRWRHLDCADPMSIRQFKMGEITRVMLDNGQVIFGVVRSVHVDGSGTIEALNPRVKPRLTGLIYDFEPQYGVARFRQVAHT